MANYPLKATNKGGRFSFRTTRTSLMNMQRKRVTYS